MHHTGQFFHKNSLAKVQTSLQQKLFVNIYHDLTYHLETSTNDPWQKCSEENNDGLDNCIIKVFFSTWTIKHTFNLKMFFPKAMDEHYIKTQECVMPFQTFKLEEKKCIPRSDMKSNYWKFLQNIVFEEHCQIPCSSMEVTYPPFAYDVGLPDEAYVKLYLLSVIKVQTSYWSYPIISLLAEVGGYMGLLLGMSLMDVNKVLYWSYNLYKKRKA